MNVGDRIRVTLHGSPRGPFRATVVSVGRRVALLQIDGASTSTELVRDRLGVWRFGHVDGRRCEIETIIGGGCRRACG